MEITVYSKTNVKFIKNKQVYKHKLHNNLLFNFGKQVIVYNEKLYKTYLFHIKGDVAQFVGKFFHFQYQ